MEDLVRVDELVSSDPSEDDIEDINNYKGIYFNDDPSTKFQDPLTGAHFDYADMVQRLKFL